MRGNEHKGETPQPVERVRDVMPAIRREYMRLRPTTNRRTAYIKALQSGLPSSHFSEVSAFFRGELDDLYGPGAGKAFNRSLWDELEGFYAAPSTEAQDVSGEEDGRPLGDTEPAAPTNRPSPRSASGPQSQRLSRADGATRIGEVIEIRRLLRRYRHLVVEERGPELVLMGPTQPTVSAADAGEPVWQPPGKLRSARGRLVAAAVAIANTDLAPSVDGHECLDLALRGLPPNGDETRVLALDLLTLRQIRLLERLPLPADELRLLQARSSSDRGDTKATITHLRKTQEVPEGFAVCAVLRSQPWGARGPSPDALDFLDEVGDAQPVASAILAALGRAEVPETAQLQDAVRDLREWLPGDATSSPEVSVANSILGWLESPTESVQRDDTTPSVDWFTARAAALEGRETGEVRSWSRSVTAGLLDDALDLGFLADDVRLPARGSVDVGNGREVSISTYVRARLHAEELTDDEVAGLGWWQELGRRAIAHSDLRLVDAIEDDAESARARVLLKLHAGETVSDEELDDLPGNLRAWASSLRNCIQNESWDEATPELLKDASAWPILARVRSPDVTSAPHELQELTLLFSARRALFDWKWDEAIEIAREGLRVSRKEAVRDEFLNILACAQWQLGNAEAAVRALEKALEGEYSEALLVNVAVVARELEPRLAGEHLGKLAMEAPSVALRAKAAIEGLRLWYVDPEPWSDDAESDEYELPRTLRDALRGLLSEPLDETDFRLTLRALAIWDSHYIAHLEPSEFGPHQGSLAAGIYSARAEGIEAYVQVLSAQLRKSSAPDWLVDERDSLVQTAIDALWDEDTLPLAAASFALTLLDEELPMTPHHQILLKGLAVAAIAQGIDPESGEPKDRFLDMLLEAQEESDRLEDEERARLAPIIRHGCESLARCYGMSRSEGLSAAFDSYNAIIEKVGGLPRRSINMTAVREATLPIFEYCEETIELFERVRDLVEDVELEEALAGLRDDARRLRDECRKLIS